MKNPSTETSESEAIRSDIEHTRESMDRTLDKIGERMTPRHLLDQLLDFFRSHNGQGAGAAAGSVLTSVGRGAGRAANGVVTVVRRNPVPSLLIGAGITWAVVENRRRHRGNGHESDYDKSPYGEQMGGKPWEETEAYAVSEVEAVPNMNTNVGEKISNAGASIGETMKEKTQILKEKTQRVGKRISEGARVVGRTAQRGYTTGRTKFVEASEEYPIAMGMGFLAAGVLLGLALPHSRKEDQWIGRTADRTKQQARQQIQTTAQDLLERGKQVASAATSAATQAAKETAQQQSVSGQSQGAGQSRAGAQPV